MLSFASSLSRVSVAGALLALLLYLGAGAIAAPRPANAQAEPGPWFVDCSVADLKRVLKSVTVPNYPEERVLIYLSPGCVYNLTEVDHVGRFAGPNGLPELYGRDITIRGFGATIQRDPRRTTPQFRLFFNLAFLTLEDLTIAHGDAGIYGGGAIEQWAGSLTLRRVLLYHNRAAYGGALRIENASYGVTVVNSTFYTNEAKNDRGFSDDRDENTRGGAISFGTGDGLTIDSSTIALNWATGGGGGISLPNNAINVSIRNSIIAGNQSGPNLNRPDDCSGQPPRGGAPSFKGRFIGNQHSLFGKDTGCVPQREPVFERDLPTNDLFISPGDIFTKVLNYAGKNGGVTLTLSPRPGSPAIDAGECLQREDGRNVRRPLPPAGRCDIGAVEITPVGVVTMDPVAAAGALGQPVTLTLTWTVPAPAVWRDLTSIDLRFTDGDDVPLWLRFDEASGMLALIDPDSGRLIGSGTPGEEGELRAAAAALDLAGSRLTGSGSTGHSVTLTLVLTFLRAPAIAEAYQLEVQATDDSGAIQGFDVIGGLAIAGEA